MNETRIVTAKAHGEHKERTRRVLAHDRKPGYRSPVKIKDLLDDRSTATLAAAYLLTGGARPDLFSQGGA